MRPSSGMAGKQDRRLGRDVGRDRRDVGERAARSAAPHRDDGVGERRGLLLLREERRERVLVDDRRALRALGDLGDRQRRDLLRQLVEGLLGHPRVGRRAALGGAGQHDDARAGRTALRGPGFRPDAATSATTEDARPGRPRSPGGPSAARPSAAGPGSGTSGRRRRLPARRRGPTPRSAPCGSGGCGSPFLPHAPAAENPGAGPNADRRPWTAVRLTARNATGPRP